MTPLKNKGYIYKVTNIITGQFYIGQRSSYTGSPEDDLGVHYFTSSRYVRPLFKSNTSEWMKEVLYQDIQFAETLDDMEGYAIHKVIKDPLCMNRYDPSTCVGFSTAGKKLSAEIRAKKSVANHGKHRSAEAIAKTSAANRGKHRSAETKAKMQEAWKHRPPMSAETRAKMRGRHSSEETRAKLSATLRGRKVSEETRMKLSAALRGKHKGPMSEEQKAKISTTERGKHLSAETREKMSLAAKRRHIHHLEDE